MNRFSDFLSARLPFYYGYLMVVVAVLAQICSSPGQTFAISAFTPHLQESLGLSNSNLAAAYMFGTLLAALPLMLIGPISDRFGLRWTTVAVATALAGACGLASQASGFASLLVSFMLLRFLGQGALTLLSSNIVAMWFELRLGRVNSIMSLGGAAAFAIVPPALLGAIQSIGWRATYQAMGLFIFCSLVPLLVLFLRNQPEELGQFPDGAKSPAYREMVGSLKDLSLAEALRGRAFWILGTAMSLWAMIGTGIVFYALPIFQQHGVPPEQTKLLFTTLSLAMLTTQVTGGVLADRYPMNRLLAIAFALLTAGVVVVPLTTAWVHVHLFAGLFGAGQGLAMAVNNTIWVRYYGRRHLGKIRGAVWCTTVAGSGCGPFLLGIIVDGFGSFDPGLWMFVALLLPIAPLALLATRPRPAGHLAESLPQAA